MASSGTLGATGDRRHFAFPGAQCHQLRLQVDSNVHHRLPRSRPRLSEGLQALFKGRQARVTAREPRLERGQGARIPRTRWPPPDSVQEPPLPTRGNSFPRVKESPKDSCHWRWGFVLSSQMLGAKQVWGGSFHPASPGRAPSAVAPRLPRLSPRGKEKSLPPLQSRWTRVPGLANPNLLGATRES